MKRLLIAALVGSLALGGCATTGTNPDISSQIAQIQKIAVQACGFLPTAETVSGIVATFVEGAAPINAIASQVANAICAAVTAKSLKVGGMAQVNGVIIEGKFVKSMKRGAQVNGVVVQGHFVR